MSTQNEEILRKYMEALNEKFKLRNELTVLKLDVPKQQYLIDKFSMQLQEKKQILEQLEAEIAKCQGEMDQMDRARAKNLTKFDVNLRSVEDVEQALIDRARNLRNTLQTRTYITTVVIVILIFFAIR